MLNILQYRSYAVSRVRLRRVGFFGRRSLEVSWSRQTFGNLARLKERARLKEPRKVARPQKHQGEAFRE